MGIISRLKSGAGKPVRRWVKLLPDDEDLKDVPKGTSSFCEVEVEYIDEDRFSALAKDVRDADGNIKDQWSNQVFRAFCVSYWKEAVTGLRGFNRFTAGLLGDKLLAVSGDISVADEVLDRDDARELADMIGPRPFFSVLSGSRQRDEYVRDQLEREKKDSKLTPDSSPADTPPSSAAA